MEIDLRFAAGWILFVASGFILGGGIATHNQVPALGPCLWVGALGMAIGGIILMKRK